MSVIVKGMRMPNNCMACDLEEVDDCGNGYRCPLIYKGYTAKIRQDGKLPKCPLVEIPEKHGDLIDRDALLKEFELAQKSADMHGREYANAFYSSGNEISTEWWAVEDMVENAPVVIEAEGE